MFSIHNIPSTVGLNVTLFGFDDAKHIREIKRNPISCRIIQMNISIDLIEIKKINFYKAARHKY